MVLSTMRWAGVHEGLAPLVESRAAQCRAAYSEDPSRIEEDARREVASAEGGYGRKQIHELVQNAADALRKQPGRIEVRLTDDVLYVANEGEPVTEDGVIALLYSHLSRKEEDQIGRFGLGFKSVTAISTAPQVFSRSGSFGFDRSRAEVVIRDIHPDAPSIPTLRMAWPLDPDEWASRDRVLAGLMEWATTVVRIPLHRGRHDPRKALLEDLEKFPTQFVLFADHVRRLELVGPDGNERSVTVRTTPEGERVLRDGEEESRWRVFSQEHAPSEAALADAGQIRKRERITATWAVPLRDRTAIGEFWSYFPVEEYTTLSGLINSQWKLTDDRVSLLRGRYNEEILTQVLPGLLDSAIREVDRALPAGEYLDLLPARGLEARGWADDVVNEPVYDRLRRGPSLVGLDGELHAPAEMTIHPRGLLESWKELWRAHPPADGVWVGHEIDATTTRRSKAERLLVDESRRVTTREWVEALVADHSAEGSAAALSLLGHMLLEGTPEQVKEVSDARVVLVESGHVVAARPGHVFLRSHDDEDGTFVHPDVLANDVAARTLVHLGVGPLDPQGRLRRALAEGADWAEVWPLTRALEPAEASRALMSSVDGHPLDAVMVRARSGSWRPLGTVLRPGVVFEPDTTDDAPFVLDERYHREDLACLESLGLTDRPVARSGAPEEPWFGAYEDLAKQTFIRSLNGPRPHVDKLEVTGSAPPLHPLQMLASLSPKARVRMTNAALRNADERVWTARHTTNAGYGSKLVESPDYWCIGRHGMLDTALGPWPVGASIDPASVPKDLRAYLPVPTGTVPGKPALLPLSSLDDVDAEDWIRIVGAAEVVLDPKHLGGAYAVASSVVTAPPTVLAHVGGERERRAPDEVAVTADEGTFRALRRGRIPVLLAPDEDLAHTLAEEWGLRDAEDLVGYEFVAETIGESELLVDRFPSLRMWMDPKELAPLEIQQCVSIEQVVTTPSGRDTTMRASALLSPTKVLFTAADPAEAIAQISEEFELGLLPEDLRAIVDQEHEQRSSALVQEIREAADDLDRLVAAVGPEALQREIPATTLEAVTERGEVGHRDLAVLAMAIHGHGVLGRLRGVLVDRGLNPPERWNGGARARRFVTDLGFGPEWAGFPDDGERGATLSVDGPAVPRPLHDYQRLVGENIRAMIRGAGPGRGMVALPTGAGKTRVAVQALTESVVAGELHGPVVWVAQTDELCEQAVQSWAGMWRAYGSPEKQLVISRFWGSNPIAEHEEATEVIVSTPQTLLNARSSESYQWLTKADMVVVDEAHTSVAPMYNAVLDWLGRGRSRKERRLLLGLTATPFRGTSESETKRLAGRYDNNRLEAGAFDGDMYTALQEKGVLARVSQRVLGGSTIDLTGQELIELRERRLLPKGVEQRLGQDLARSRRIVDSIIELPNDWTVLLFATSVENAESMAAQLAFAGVPATAISGTTRPAHRRHAIERFRAGELRVLTNYNVLTQGFDAPEVRAVYVTRPTWSPNLYQQMIGRGLRGPANGGSELVDIVNVQDNVSEFGEQLAFTHFEHLWSADEARTE